MQVVGYRLLCLHNKDWFSTITETSNISPFTIFFAEWLCAVSMTTPIVAEQVLGPLLSHQCCFSQDDHQGDGRVFYVDVCLENSLQLLEIKLFSSLSE